MLATILLLTTGLGGHVNAQTPCFCTADFNPVCYKGKRYSSKCFAQCAGAPDAMITAAPAGGGLDSVLGCPDDLPPKSWPLPMRGLAAFAGGTVDAFLSAEQRAQIAEHVKKHNLTEAQHKHLIEQLTKRPSDQTNTVDLPPKSWPLPMRGLAAFVGVALTNNAGTVDTPGSQACAELKDLLEVTYGFTCTTAFGSRAVYEALLGTRLGSDDLLLASITGSLRDVCPKTCEISGIQACAELKDLVEVKYGFTCTTAFGTRAVYEALLGCTASSRPTDPLAFPLFNADLTNDGDRVGSCTRLGKDDPLLASITGTLRDVCPKTCVAPGDRCAKTEQPECPPDQGCICAADVNYVCDNKGNLYSNACRAECAGNFGKLLAPIPGADAFSAPTCPDCHLYKCPANAKRKPNRLCYDTFGDCDCNPGYTRSDKLQTCERDCICTKEFDPVCYAGFLYNNECLAKCAGAKPGADHSMHSHMHIITKPTPGAGPFDDPSCPQDCACTKEINARCWKGKQYNNPCLAECAGATTGELMMPDFGRGDACVNTAAPVEVFECKNDFKCPEDSKRKPNRKCYDTVEDCYCLDGYEMKNGKCFCTNKYECPKHSKRKKNRKCYNNFDDCECDTGFFKDGNECEFKEVTVVAGCPAACKTCEDGGGSNGRKTDPHCKNYCSKKNFCGASNEYKNGGTDCTRCEGGANVPPPPKVTPSPTNTPTIDRFVDTSLNPDNNAATPPPTPPTDDGDKLSKGAIAAIAIACVASLAIAGAFFLDRGGAPPPQDLKPVADLGATPVAEAATSNPTDNNGLAQV